MATGTWQKYYNGAWSQPGVGGKESNLVPTEEQPKGFTPVAKEYNPASVGSYKTQVAAGLAPPTSPLFVMDITWNAYLGLWVGQPQNPDQSGNAPQEWYGCKDLSTPQWFFLGDSGNSYHAQS